MASAISPWWRGLTSDHIYESCPGRKRGLRWLKHAGWDEPVSTAFDPHGDGVCGICLRWWRARSRRSELAATVAAPLFTDEEAG